MPKAQSAVDRVTLTYDLTQLPTAQHKAGLAGLVLQIQEMQERHEEDDEFAPEDLPELGEVTTQSATVTLTERSCQTLFDELYTARIEEVRVKSKWQGAKLLRTDVVEELESDDGKAKKTTYYVYEVVTPRNPVLMKHMGAEIWQKLWRDMLWQIPRAKPTTRNPFNERAEGRPCGEGGKVWKELVRWEKDRRKNRVRTTSVSSALLLDAQDETAEQVPFAVQSDHALLLHFWILTVLIYVPWQLKVDQSDPSRSRDEPVGFSLAIPEVRDLKAYCQQYVKVLQDLATKPEERGYRPRAACIDLPAQSALEFLESQAWLTGEMVGSKARLRRLFHAVEYRHLAKFGNNVKNLGSGRIVPERDLLTKYEGITGPEGFRNPIFRAAMLTSLLDRSVTQWYEPFAKLFEALPREFFLRSEKTPRLMWNFPADVNQQFRNLQHSHPELQPEDSPVTDDNPSDDRLAALVLRMVRTYVRKKAEDRSGFEYKSFKDDKTRDQKTGKERVNVPKPYRDAQEHVAEKVFLEIRSRHGRDFTQYFADCFGSVAQRIGKEDDFQTITHAVIEHPDKVRTLTLLALSACS